MAAGNQWIQEGWIQELRPVVGQLDSAGPLARENYGKLNYPKWPVTREKAITRRVSDPRRSVPRPTVINSRAAACEPGPRTRAFCVATRHDAPEYRYRSAIVAATRPSFCSPTAPTRPDASTLDPFQSHGEQEITNGPEIRRFRLGTHSRCETGELRCLIWKATGT